MSKHKHGEPKVKPLPNELRPMIVASPNRGEHIVPLIDPKVYTGHLLTILREPPVPERQVMQMDSVIEVKVEPAKPTEVKEIELTKPTVVEKVVEKIVEKPIIIEKVVEKVVEKIVEKPVMAEEYKMRLDNLEQDHNDLKELYKDENEAIKKFAEEVEQLKNAEIEQLKQKLAEKLVEDERLKQQLEIQNQIIEKQGTIKKLKKKKSVEAKEKKLDNLMRGKAANTR